MRAAIRPESPLLRRNLPTDQQAVQALADQFNADEQLWKSLEPLRKLRQTLHPQMKSRKRKELDLLDFEKAQLPKDCVGYRRVS